MRSLRLYFFFLFFVDESGKPSCRYFGREIFFVCCVYIDLMKRVSSKWKKKEKKGKIKEFYTENMNSSWVIRAVSWQMSLDEKYIKCSVASLQKDV